MGLIGQTRESCPVSCYLLPCLSFIFIVLFNTTFLYQQNVTILTFEIYLKTDQMSLISAFVYTNCDPE